jgi:hypothetical protein
VHTTFKIIILTQLPLLQNKASINKVQIVIVVAGKRWCRKWEGSTMNVMMTRMMATKCTNFFKNNTKFHQRFTEAIKEHEITLSYSGIATTCNIMVC